MRLALGYAFAALALLALLFNALLVYRYCVRGRGSSPIALLVALFGTLAAICFKGTGLSGTSYVVLFIGLFIFSVLTSFPISTMTNDSGHKHRPSPKASASNWRNSELPFTAKLQLTLRNNLIKLRKGQSCCGNYGEPGC